MSFGSNAIGDLHWKACKTCKWRNKERDTSCDRLISLQDNGDEVECMDYERDE
jgi:hypothetical protein